MKFYVVLIFNFCINDFCIKKRKKSENRVFLIVNMKKTYYKNTRFSLFLLNFYFIIYKTK